MGQTASSLCDLARGTLTLTLFQFASKPLLALFFILLGNRAFFSDESYGRLESLLAVVNLFLIPADLGLESYTTRRLARDSGNTSQWLPTQVSLKIMLNLLACLLLVFFIAGFELYRGREIRILLLCGAVSLLSGLSAQSYLRGISRGHQRMEIEGLMGVIEKMIVLITGVLALFTLGSLAMVLGAIALGSIGAAFWAGVRIRKIEPSLRIAWPVPWRTLAESFPFALNAICISLFYNMDRVFLSFHNETSVAAYSRGLRLVWAILLFPQMMSIAIYPIFSRLREQPEERLKVSRTALRSLLFLVLPITTGGWVLAGPLLDRVYGAGDEAIFYRIESLLGGDSLGGHTVSSACLRILLLGLPFTCGNFLLGPALYAVDREHWNLLASAQALLVAFILNLALIPLLGPAGTALAVTLTQAAYCLQMYRYQRKVDSSWIQKNRLEHLLACCLLQAMVMLALLRIHWSLAFFGGGLAYLALTKALNLWPYSLKTSVASISSGIE
ncbi:MAG: Polysaccharide biosynthesis protein [Candidatus Hinthialibacteria bacterium OLB16]|nr:MAG: Polysaccharide biosynthesis protein [Candidatus Hinthialibacteria bacterium OLB16]